MLWTVDMQNGVYVRFEPLLRRVKVLYVAVFCRFGTQIRSLMTITQLV
jgi:hypothetical protein